MPGFNIAELIATFEAKGAQSTVQDIGRVQAGFDRTGAAASKAGEQIDRTVLSMDRAGRAAAGAAGGTSKLREAQLRAAAATERYNALLADERATLARVAAAEASVIAANRRLAASSPARSLEATGAAAEAQVGALGRAKSGVVGFMDSMAKLGLGLAGFEAVVKGIELVKSGSDFQKQMLQIQTMAGASARDVKTLSNAVLGMAGDVAASPEDLAKSLYHVEQNSHGLLSTAQMLNVLKVGAEGAKIGLADVEDTTNAMTIATASGIKGVQNMSSAMGTMLAIAGTGDMRLSDLTEAMGTGILSIAKQFGATLNDVAAVLATLGDNGIRGTDAAQGLRQVLMGMADPAKRGADSLAQVGLSMTDLRDDMEKHGLVHAMNDLDEHMKAAGVTGQKVGGFITDVFGRRAGKSIAVLFGEMDRVNAKAAEGLKGAQSFASRWEATTKTAAFGWESLGAAIQAGAIKAFEDAAPAIGRIGQLLADDVPKAAHVAEDALAPFITAWHVLDEAVGPVESTLSGVGDVLQPLAPLVKGVTGATLSMWLAFKGYQVARVAVQAVADGVTTMAASARNGITSTGAEAQLLATNFTRSSSEVGAALYGTAADAEATSAIMQAEFAKIEASAQASASTQAEAQLAAMRTYQQVSAAEIAAMEETAAAARATAIATATAAEEASLAVNTAGEAARVGWASLAGPIGLAVIGVMTLVTMFHKSSEASQEASDAAKAYGDALKSAQSPADILTAVIDQLKKNDVAAEIDRLNAALGETAVAGPAFATAIADGGQKLDEMRQHLQSVIGAQAAIVQQQSNLRSLGGTNTDASGKVTVFDADKLERAGKALGAARNLLAQLNTEFSALSEATKKDLQDTKTWAGVSSAIQTVSQSTHIASQTASDYAQMLGIYVDKNGVAAASSSQLSAAVNTVAHAYNTASLAGDTFLAALKTFSTSSGTANDRAALIGATLVAANGDLLAYAGSLANASDATHKLGQDVRQAASQIGDSGISTQSYLASLINLKTGTIDYRKAGAGPLIQDLQAMQSAAMNAAQATFQHERATRSAKDAADAAYQVYKAQTSGALVDEARKLGLTAGQAQKLADKYFGMPKRVKTLIEQEGANPIVTVLNQIGKQLAFLTGHPWKINTDAHTQAAQTKLGRLLTTMHQIGQGVSAQVLVTTTNQTTGTKQTHKGSASGTNGRGLPLGVSSVGEQGPELAVNDGRRVEILSNSQSKAYLAATGMTAPGFAGGTMPPMPASDLIKSGGFGHLWITKLDQAGKQLVATVLSVAASLHKVQGAPGAVSHAIAGAVRPDPSTAQGWMAQLAAVQKVATADREQYEIAKQNLHLLNQHAATLKRDAQNLADQASAMKSSTKAEKAAKDAAEARAKAAQKVADAADKMASRAQKAYDKIKQASQSATEKAKQDAQSLVAAVQSDFDTLQQQIQGFRSTIGQGLTAGSDLNTIWGNLSSNADSAKQALDAAQAALEQATPDTSKLAAAQAAQAQATAAQAAAHAQLTQALAGGDAAAILAAQQAQTTAAANLADAQQAVQAATPTPDQLAAQAQAQAQLTAAQQAYNAAVQQTSAGGVADVLAQFAASEKQFADHLTQLQKDGAGQALITQLASMGAQGGDALAQGLINDPKSLAAISKSMDAIQNIAGQESDKLAKGYYSAGVNSMEQLLAGIEKKFPSLVKALAPLAAQLAAMFTFTPTVAGTSGSAVGGKSITTDALHQLGTVAKEYGVTVAQLIAANPSLKGDTSKSAVKKGTHLTIPAFASGVTDFPGGLAMVHRDELLVNLPRGTDVIPANRAKSAAFGMDTSGIERQLDTLNAQVSTLAQDMGEVQARVGAALYERAGAASVDRRNRYRQQGVSV